MKLLIKKIGLILGMLLFVFSIEAKEGTESSTHQHKQVDIEEIVFEHITDSYYWHITNFGKTSVTVPLPIILYDKMQGWSFFSSSHLYKGEKKYDGYYIANEGKYRGKIVKDISSGVVRPTLDLSLTKIAFAILFNSLLLVLIILGVARWYKKHDIQTVSPGGFVGFMEAFILIIHDEVIKECVGPRYRKFAPYLLTAFFFILINNLMGLIPIFPGGANVTGNIAITMVLAIATFIAVNLFASRHYWKEIFWPDVPWWLKFPLPIMPIIEVFGLFTKPFALMIRLFANVLSGHMAILVLASLVFIGAAFGVAMTTGFTIGSIVFNVFMDALEILVAFIQAYVFTMLSAVFIGMAQEHGKADKNEEI